MHAADPSAPGRGGPDRPPLDRLALERLPLEGGAAVDLRRGVVEREGAGEALTTKEIALLEYLGARPGVVVSFEELHDEVWRMAPSVVSRAAYFTWRRLVKKVEPDPERPANLVSHHGDGVSYRPPRDAAGPAAVAWTGELAPLVGREALVEDVRARLAGGVRLVTLTGPGGAGKTRLARHLAAGDAAARFVDLRGAHATGSVGAAVGAAVGATVAAALGAGRAEAGLGAGPLLLVLDGCEPVVEAVAERAAAWLATFPALRILATSRARLRVPGENVVLVGPLGEEDAVRLFVERAQAADDTFDAPASRADVAAVVEALDRLPLAIELTAARVRLLPPRSLRRELERAALGPGARGPEGGAGVGGKRGKPEGAGAIAGAGAAGGDAVGAAVDATVARSWDLLAPWERDALADLAVFRGAAPLAAIAAVVRLPPGTTPLDALQRLLDHSLLRVDLAGPEPRYAAWAPVHTFARARLADDPAAEAAAVDRHARWYAALGPPALGGHRALHGHLADLLAAGRAPDPAVATAAGLRAGTVLAEVAALDDAEAHARELAVRAPPALRPWVELYRARLAQFGGRVDEAIALATGVLDAARAGGPDDPLLLAAARLRVGTAEANVGRLDEAIAHVTAALPALAAAGDGSAHSSALLVLGYACARRGDREAAIRHTREALAEARREGDEPGADSARRELARLQMRMGQARAAELTLRSLRASQPHPLHDLQLATALFLRGRAGEAAPLLDGAEAELARRRLHLHEGVALVQRALCAIELEDDDALAAACDRGEALVMEAGLPHDPTPALRGLHLARTGDAAGARSALARGVPTGGDPATNATLHLVTAEARAILGDDAEARTELDAAASIAATLGIPPAGLGPGWGRLAQRLQHPAR